MEDQSIVLDFTDTFKSKKTNTQGIKPWAKKRQQNLTQNHDNKENKHVLCQSPSTYELNSPLNSPTDIQCRFEQDTFRVEESPSKMIDTTDVGSITPKQQSNKYAPINSQLEILGYPSIHNEESVINLVELLIQEINKLGGQLKNNESLLHRTTSDCKRLQSDKETLKLQVQCSNQDIASLESKVAMIQSKFKKEKAIADDWAKELQVKIAKMEGQYKQWQNAMNRKESEYERLQARMQTLQTQRDRAFKRTIQMVKPMVVHEAISSEKTIEQLQELAEASLTQKVNYLTAENEELRSSLATLQSLYSSKAREGSVTAAVPSPDGSISDLFLPMECFEMPSEVLQSKIELMNKTVTNMVENTHDVSHERLLELFEEAKAIIVEQDQLLNVSIRQGPISHPLEPENRFENDKEREELEELRNQLEEDRQLILEEAKKLDRERALFETERLESFNVDQPTTEKSTTTSTSLYGLVSTPLAERKKKFDTKSGIKSKLPIPPTPLTKGLLDEFM